MRQTYKGGCHCGAVRYEATVDLAAGTYRCNCSICHKLRNWIVQVPDQDFRYTSGAEIVTRYNPIPGGAGTFHFCPVCGVRIGTAVRPTERSQFTGENRFNLSVPSLQGVPVEDLLAAPVRWVDRLNDRGMEPPDEVRHL